MVTPAPNIIKDKKYIDRECDRLLMQDLQPVKKTVDGLVKVPLNEYQRATLYSFTYNVGTSAFSKSTLLKRLNAGDQAGACEELRSLVQDAVSERLKEELQVGGLLHRR